jgi:hypothetical protein
VIIIKGETNISGLIPIFTEMHATSHMSVLSGYETYEACKFHDKTLLKFLEAGPI